MELVTVNTSDGIFLDAAWYPNNESNVGVILLHGKGQNFYTSVVRWLAPYLSTIGFSSIAINLRDHDHRETEGIELANKDINAGVNFLKDKGIDKIFLIGVSFGSNKAALYPSEKFTNDLIKGLILLSAGGSRTDLPDLWRRVVKNLEGVTLPLFVIQAGSDEFVSQPREAGLELIEASNNSPLNHLVVIDGANHGFTNHKEEVSIEICNWLTLNNRQKI